MWQTISVKCFKRAISQPTVLIILRASKRYSHPTHKFENST
jgi:hypothetical protein